MLDLQPHREASFRLMPSSARRRQGDSKIMNTHHIKLGLAVLTSFGLGAAVMHQIHAQARPPAYVISEIEVTDPDAYNKRVRAARRQGTCRRRAETARGGRQNHRARWSASGIARRSVGV